LILQEYQEVLCENSNLLSLNFVAVRIFVEFELIQKDGHKKQNEVVLFCSIYIMYNESAYFVKYFAHFVKHYIFKCIMFKNVKSEWRVMEAGEYN
jgi:hypothetical protein